MVTCQSSERGWEVTVELPADFLSLGRGSVRFKGWTDVQLMGDNCRVDSAHVFLFPG